MESLFSIIDIGRLGLSIEKFKVNVASENIANVNNASYISKKINFDQLLAFLDDASSQDMSRPIEIPESSLVSDNSDVRTSLDQEVISLTDSEVRYQVVAQSIQKQFGLMDLVIGGKGK